MKPESNIAVRILVRDFKKMYDFYKDTLEYEVNWGSREGTYASFSIPGEDKPAFAIFKKEGYKAYDEYADIYHGNKGDDIVMCMGCDDVDAHFEYLKNKGVHFIGEPRNIKEWYYRVVLFRDPEGNLIDLGGPMKEDENE